MDTTSEHVAPSIRHTEPTKLMGFTFGQLLLILAWPVVALGAFYMLIGATKQDMNAVVAGVKSRPPIKVLYVNSHLNEMMAKGLSGDKALLNMQAQTVAWGKAGYLVIDSATVLAAPEQVEVK